MSTADFKLIRPAPVTDARLTSTSVPEAVAPTYAGGTTYAAGAWAGLAPVYGSAQLVYESKSAGNVGNPLPVPPATTTTFWKLVGTVYPPYASGSSCGLGDIVSSISADVHLLYESQVAGNTGNPLADETKWLVLGSTNARAMFDATYGSQTEQLDAITSVITPDSLINTVFLGNLDSASVSLAQADSGYSKTQALNAHPVLTWYDWFYEPIVRQADAVFTDVPPYLGSALTVTVSNPGALAKCGICIMGQSATIGQTQWELLGSIVSYSGTAADKFGNTTFVPHAKVKRLNFEVDIPAGFESEAHRILTDHTDVPTLFIGSTRHAMAMVYGALGSWQVPLSRLGKKASVEVIGLT